MNRPALTLLASLFVAAPYQAAFGEASQLQRVPTCSEFLKSCSWSAEITGAIDNATFEKIKKIVNETRQKADAQKFVLNPPYVELDTPGGSVSAAIAIGRLLRKERATVAVADGAVCYSACVLIFAGAVNRAMDPQAKLGIHRPYLEVPRGEITPGSVQEAYQQTLQDIRSYFREMNVSEQLADAMLRIEPKNIRLLDYGALLNYGLTSTDPIEQETLELQDAQWFKLDRQEYMQRKAVTERVCPKDHGFPEIECRFAIMEGRPPPASRPTGYAPPSTPRPNSGGARAQSPPVKLFPGTLVPGQ
jgi:hypothetical protein